MSQSKLQPGPINSDLIPMWLADSYTERHAIHRDRCRPARLKVRLVWHAEQVWIPVSMYPRYSQVSFKDNFNDRRFLTTT